MNQLVEELYSKIDNQEKIIRTLQQRINKLEQGGGIKHMRITIYLSDGVIEFTSDKTLPEIIDYIQINYPNNLGFKITREEPILTLKREN